MECDVVPVTRIAQNCSILSCAVTNAAAVVDPGGDAGHLRDILEWQDLRLEVILVTQGHMDHGGGAAELAELTGAPIHGPHRADAHLVESMEEFGARYNFRCRNYQPSRWLEDGETVVFGTQTLEVLHCPGHTQGHLVYFHRKSRQAFVGDILFRGAIGQWEHDDGNLPQLLDTIRARLFPLGDDVRFVPGHGPCSTFGHEREHNPFVGDRAITEWKARRAAAISGS